MSRQACRQSTRLRAGLVMVGLVSLTMAGARLVAQWLEAAEQHCVAHARQRFFSPASARRVTAASRPSRSPAGRARDRRFQSPGARSAALPS